MGKVTGRPKGRTPDIVKEVNWYYWHTNLSVAKIAELLDVTFSDISTRIEPFGVVRLPSDHSERKTYYE